MNTQTNEALCSGHALCRGNDHHPLCDPAHRAADRSKRERRGADAVDLDDLSPAEIKRRYQALLKNEADAMEVMRQAGCQGDDFSTLFRQFLAIAATAPRAPGAETRVIARIERSGYNIPGVAKPMIRLIWAITPDEQRALPHDAPVYLGVATSG